jgi:hypothetical protein
MFAMVPEVLLRHLMSTHGEQRGALARSPVDHREIRFHGEHAEVESHVMIWAQAKDVAGVIWSVMRAAERANMGSLGVCPRGRENAQTADLASVLMY